MKTKPIQDALINRLHELYSTSGSDKYVILASPEFIEDFSNECDAYYELKSAPTPLTGFDTLKGGVYFVVSGFKVFMKSDSSLTDKNFEASVFVDSKL